MPRRDDVWRRRPYSPAERRAAYERGVRFARSIVMNTRQQNYIRYVVNRMRAMQYPSYAIRAAVNAIRNGRDPRFSFGNYNELGDGTYTYDD